MPLWAVPNYRVRIRLCTAGTGASMGTGLKHVLWLAVASALAASLEAHAQAKGPERTVQMFNFLCLSQLPDLDGVTKAAGFGEFAQITGKELQQYQPAVPAEKLYAWSYHEHGAKYVLTAARSKPDAAFKQAMPAFAKSTNVACSLLFPAADAKEAVLQELIALLGRAPDQTSEEGSMRVYVWSGQNAKLLSHVHYYAPLQNGPTGVLSASTFIKD
jgi:hypothetical protein